MYLNKLTFFAAVLCLFLTAKAVAQESGFASMGVSTSSTYKIDEHTKIYDKTTGKRLDPEWVMGEIEKGKGGLEHEINERGEVSAFIYNPGKPSKGRMDTRDESLRIKPNQPFHDYIFKTTEGETLSSEKLKGKTVVLNFNLQLRSPFINPQNISDFEKVIQNVPPGRIVFPIILTHSSKNDISDFIKQLDISFPIVPDARNFMDKFIITKFPSYVVINQDGTLRAYVEDLEELREVLMK